MLFVSIRLWQKPVFSRVTTVLFVCYFVCYLFVVLYVDFLKMTQF